MKCFKGMTLTSLGIIFKAFYRLKLNETAIPNERFQNESKVKRQLEYHLNLTIQQPTHSVSKQTRIYENTAI